MATKKQTEEQDPIVAGIIKARKAEKIVESKTPQKPIDLKLLGKLRLHY